MCEYQEAATYLFYKLSQTYTLPHAVLTLLQAHFFVLFMLFIVCTKFLNIFHFGNK